MRKPIPDKQKPITPPTITIKNLLALLYKSIRSNNKV